MCPAPAAAIHHLQQEAVQPHGNWQRGLQADDSFDCLLFDALQMKQLHVPHFWHHFWYEL